MADRRPGAVPDEPADAAARLRPEWPGAALDTDGDGRADTAVYAEGVDLVLATDLDGDGLADQVLRIGADGVAREWAGHGPGPGGVLDGLLGGAEVGLGG